METQMWRSAILDMKQSITTLELCETFPAKFLELLEYSHTLSFAEKFNYMYI